MCRKDGTAGRGYGTERHTARPHIKVRKKCWTRLKEDGESLVMPGVRQDERDMLVERAPQVGLFHRSLSRLANGADPLSTAKRADGGAVAAAAWRTLASTAATKIFDGRR